MPGPQIHRFLLLSFFLLPLSSASFSVEPLASLVEVVARDQGGNLYIAASVSSGDVQTSPGAFQQKYAGGTCGTGKFATPIPCADVYVRKIAPDGTVVFATLLGGSSEDRAVAIAVDSEG